MRHGECLIDDLVDTMLNRHVDWECALGPLLDPDSPDLSVLDFGPGRISVAFTKGWLQSRL